MPKIDKVVIKETRSVALWMFILSAVMQAVFLVIGKWDYTVLLGNLLSYAVMMLNIFAVGILLQIAVERDPKGARQFVKATAGIRFLVMFGLLTVGVLLDCFSTWTVIIPVFFPRLTVTILSLLAKKNSRKEEQVNGCGVDSNREGIDGVREESTPDTTTEA